jgi:hypothetical protein
MLPNVTFIPQIEVTAITAAMDENTKEGRRDGTGGRRIGAPRKKWRKGVHQVICVREEREGVTGGATGGQRRGRMKGSRVRRDEGETERTRGGNVFGGEGSKRSPSSPLTALPVQGGQLCVWGGRRVVVHVMANRLLHSK